MGSPKPHQVPRPAHESPRDKEKRLRRMGLNKPPTLRPGEVYIAGPNSKCFHSAWCTAMNGTWLDGWGIGTVSRRAAEAAKRPCGLCEPDAAPDDPADQFRARFG